MSTNGHTKNGVSYASSNSSDEHANGSHSPSNGTDGSRSSRPSMKHGRKQSNPLAPPFIVSAPGKTIVYGEHAVVHGKAALAAATSLRSYLLCTTLTKSQRTVSLKFSDIGLDHTWDIPELPWAAFNEPSKKKKYYDLVTSLDKELVAAIKPHIATVSPKAESRMRKVHQDAASAFLYLFLSLGSERSPACVYALRSAIPIGSGLGSSASVCVCMAVALLLQCRALAGPHPDQMSKESEEQLERINRWAFVGEMLIHGNPSGVDNTVATHGHAALFQRKDYTKPPSVSILNDFPELPLLLIDTRQPRSTAAEVAKVARLKDSHPKITDHVLNAMHHITLSAYELISDPDKDAESEETIRHLGELMTLNHGLLSTMGVSHPRLERLRHLVEESGIGWFKLTGAGGGGCAITLLKTPSRSNTQLNGEAAHPAAATAAASAESKSDHSSSSAETKLRTLQDQLSKEGFAVYSATLGGDGVGVLYPAVINDEEIDQEMFLAVESRDGVEELVGGSNDENAWKYWRP